MSGLTAFQVDVAHLFFGLPASGDSGVRIFVLRRVLMEVHRSASKRGVGNDDVLHAVEHELVSFDLEPDADPPKVLVIGPTRPGTFSR